MDATIYRLMAQTQQDHWWFSARRRILEAVLRRLPLPRPARVLEVGCGTGGNLRMLLRFGPVDAVEMDEYAIAVARTQGSGADVRKGWLPEAIPFEPARQYDLVCLFDVLEHCQDDRSALGALSSLLAPGGRLLVTVPAYQWLFGAHDRAHHHFRRYTVRRLRKTARDAGFEVCRSGYFNTLLFPLVAARRLLARAGLGDSDTDARMPSPVINRLLATVFGFEASLVPLFAFPFGTSVIAVLRRAERPGEGLRGERAGPLPLDQSR
jgi:SAM-dependent methyltransferase